MGRFLGAARQHVERIEHYHKFAGINGHNQADYHYSELYSLIDRAGRSKNDKNDAVIISALRQSVEGLMKEMRERAEDGSSNSLKKGSIK